MCAKKSKSALATAEASQLRQIQELISDDDVDAAIQVLRDAQQATKRVRISSGPEGTMYKDQPDHTARIVAAKLLVEYRHGKAVQRSQIDLASINGPRRLTGADIWDRLAGEGEHVMEIMQTYIDAARAAKTNNINEVIDINMLREFS